MKTVTSQIQHDRELASKSKRINHLDGLRGLAILMVLGFHAFARWPELIPYGDDYAGFFLFQQGWLGVELFFLISGFVILMSLEKCSSLGQFIYKRWIRLFPAMLVATILIYLTAPLFINRPSGEAELLGVIPGLTFMRPSWWSAILGVEVRGIETAFWSLYVEFKFYIIVALLFFFFDKKKLVFMLFALYVSAVALHIGTKLFDSTLINSAAQFAIGLSLQYFGWFAAGSALYIFHQNQDKNWFYLGLGMAIISSFTATPEISVGSVAGALMVSLLFAFSLINEKIQTLLQSRFLLFVGLISYPLYLIHENAMVIMIATMGHLLPSMPPILYPILPITLLMTIAYIIVKYLEPMSKKMVLSLIQLVFSNQPHPRKAA